MITQVKALSLGMDEPKVIYEDNHLIAVHKPAGMLSQGDESGDASVVDWVSRYLKETYDKPGNVYVGLLHRLDRPAEGLMLLARTSKAAQRMSRQFAERKVRKLYLAVTSGKPVNPSGTLTHYVEQLPGKNIMRAHPRDGNGRKRATLEYEVLRTMGEHSLVQVELGTGRKHQIRVQMAAVGAPLAGDGKYARTAFLPDKSIALCSWELEFIHPVRKEPIRIRTEMPRRHVWGKFEPV